MKQTKVTRASKVAAERAAKKVRTKVTAETEVPVHVQEIVEKPQWDIDKDRYGEIETGEIETTQAEFPVDREDKVDKFTSPESSNIAGATYDYGSKYMVVAFKKDEGEKFYSYEDVPADLWESFKVAPSKGSFFHVNIRQQYQGIPL